MTRAAPEREASGCNVNDGPNTIMMTEARMLDRELLPDRLMHFSSRVSFLSKLMSCLSTKPTTLESFRKYTGIELAGEL
jgi:hypothetical protein